MPKSKTKKSSAKKNVRSLKAASKKKSAAKKKRGFMWKVLEELKAKRKKLEKAEGFYQSANPNQCFGQNHYYGGFSKFAGPRRRAG